MDINGATNFGHSDQLEFRFEFADNPKGSARHSVLALAQQGVGNPGYLATSPSDTCDVCLIDLGSSMTIVNGAELLQIPVIDISNIDKDTAEDLLSAITNSGFVFIKSRGTGFTSEAIDGVFELSREFFRSPQDEKAACAIGANNRGWSSMHAETLDPKHQKIGDFKEAFNLGEFVNGKAQQPLPTSLEPHEHRLRDFSERCRELCLKILRILAIGLEIDPDEGGEEWFSSRHDPSKGPSGTILRTLYYPTLFSTSASDSDIRAGAHTDYGSITLLFRLPCQAGLEILSPSSTWVPVPVQPSGTENDPFPPILVNVGDLLSYWTAGLLKSTMHRVVFPLPGKGHEEVQDRYSVAYFCHPCKDTELVTVPSKKVGERTFGNKEGGAQGTAKAITAADHLMGRLRETYGWKQDKF